MFTFGLLEKTQNSQMEEVDLDVPVAGLLIDLVEVFSAPPEMIHLLAFCWLCRDEPLSHSNTGTKGI